MEGIGIALDLKGDQMFITDWGDVLRPSSTDRTEVLLVAQGNLTGIAFSEIS